MSPRSDLDRQAIMRAIAALAQAGVGETQLANELGVPRSTIWRWAGGQEPRYSEGAWIMKRAQTLEAK
jgi:hypothetical protein